MAKGRGPGKRRGGSRKSGKAHPGKRPAKRSAKRPQRPKQPAPKKRPAAKRPQRRKLAHPWLAAGSSKRPVAASARKPKGRKPKASVGGPWQAAYNAAKRPAHRSLKAHRKLREHNKRAEQLLKKEKREAKAAVAAATTPEVALVEHARLEAATEALVEIQAFEATLASEERSKAPAGSGGQDLIELTPPRSSTSHLDGRGFRAGQGNQFLGFLEGRLGILSIVGFQPYGPRPPVGERTEVPPEVRQRVAAMELVHMADGPAEMDLEIDTICDLWSWIEDEGGMVTVEVNYDEGTGSKK